jgi:signal peptide peptidase SppA
MRDFLMRSARRPLLMERTRVDTLLAMLERGVPRPSLLSRAARAIGIRAEEDSEIPREAMMVGPRWAPDAQYESGGYLRAGAIAVIDVTDVLTPEGYVDWWNYRWVNGYQQIGGAIEAARADDAIKAILLRIDSPGGLVDGCFELAEEIRAGSARNGGKPIWAYSNMAFSAAYALASACDRIVAGRTSGVGSIGVVVLHMDQSEMLDDWGIKVEAIESAAHKTDGHSWKPLSKAAREDIRAEVMEIAEIFVGAVTAGRKITADAVRAQEARCYLAQHSEAERSGMALGLVDEIGTERQAAEALLAFLDSGSSPQPEPNATTQENDMSASKLNAEIGRILASDASEEDKQKQIVALQRKAAKASEDKKDEDAKKSESGDEDEDEESSEDKKDEDSKKSESDDEDENDKDGKKSESGDEDEEASGDEKDPEAKAVKKYDAFAVLDLPEAKGRENLAKNLARKVGARKMTVAEAQSTLKAAPKSSRLGEAMSGRDMNPGAGDSGKGAGSGLGAAVDELVKGMKR